MKTISVWTAVACTLAMGAIAGCYDEEPVRPVRTGGSTVVVSEPKPQGVASPQPAQPSSPPIINNVVQPAPAPAQPAPSATGGTTVNVQPKTVNVP